MPAWPAAAPPGTSATAEHRTDRYHDAHEQQHQKHQAENAVKRHPPSPFGPRTPMHELTPRWTLPAVADAYLHDGSFHEIRSNT